MKQKISLYAAVIVWSSVFAQYFIMLEGSQLDFLSTTVRFFSYFTILTNTLVAFYFTSQLWAKNQDVNSFWGKPGVLTAITVYILVVGIVYQVALRHTWNPQGIARVVDELLHTINPLMVLVFWVVFELKHEISWPQIYLWLIYPFIYLLITISKGYYTGFYPYPFVNVPELGYALVAVNSLILFGVFFGLSAGLVLIGKKISIAPEKWY